MRSSRCGYTMKNWLAIDGWFSIAEGMALMSLAEGKDCLEIGSYNGRSTVALASVAKSVFTVDTFKAIENGQIQSPEFTTMDQFLLNIQGFDNIEYAVGRAQDVLRSLDRMFDLVFIDGMHTYEQVKIDILLSWSLVKDDGLFTFHDYHFACVARAIAEVFDPNGVKAVEGFGWWKKSEGQMR